MDKIIRVEGSARIRKQPDLMLLFFQYQFQKERYEEVLAAYEKSYGVFLEAMEVAGISRKEVKTAHFQVHPRYEQEYDGRIYHNVFKGYEINTGLNLRLPLAFEKLSAIFDALTESGETPETTLSFGLTDEKKFKEEALREAALDAKRKAAVLGETLGLSLGHVMTLEEVTESYHTVTRAEGNPRLMKALDLEMTPEDVEAEMKVILTMEIL